MAIFGSRSTAGFKRTAICGQPARPPLSPASDGEAGCGSCRLAALEERALLSTVTVTNTHDSGSGSLREAINDAVSGEVIDFARSAYGTIHLTSGPLFVDMIDLTIEGPGPDKLTISGGGNFTDIQFSSVFPPTFPAPPGFTPSTLRISGLTIADGNASGGFGSFGDGGAIDSSGALTLSNDVLQNNEAPDGIGGAVYSSSATGSMNIDHVLFMDNSVGSPSSTSGFQLGGAIFNVAGVVDISASTFVNNQAVGLGAEGGAIQTSFGSTLNISGSTFINNQAVGSQYGAGGAIFGDPAQINIDSSNFINNLAEGGSSFETDSGGAIAMNASNLEGMGITETVKNSVFSGNKVVGQPGSGATVQGGAIASDEGTLDLSGSTFTGNQAVGGSSNTSLGGITFGGALYTQTETLEATSDTFLNNEAVGGSSPLGVLFANGGAIDMFIGNPFAPTGLDDCRQPLFGQPGRRRLGRWIWTHGRRCIRGPGFPDGREQHGISWKSGSWQPRFQRRCGTEADGGGSGMNGSI